MRRLVIGGALSNGSKSGDVSVSASAIAGDVTLKAGTGLETYAQIGHGGFNALGDTDGLIDVEAGNLISLRGGTGVGGFDSYAMIGHGGTGAIGEHGGSG